MVEDEERQRERYHPLHRPVGHPSARWRPLPTAAADDEVELQGRWETVQGSEAGFVFIQTNTDASRQRIKTFLLQLENLSLWC